VNVPFTRGATGVEELGYVHGPVISPFTTRCDTLISPPMRAFSLSTQVKVVGDRRYVSDDFAVDAKASGEIDIAFRSSCRHRSGWSIRFWRLAGLLANIALPACLKKVDVLAGTGLADPFPRIRACTVRPWLPPETRMFPQLSKYLKLELERRAACLG